MVISGIKKFFSDKNFQKDFMERGGRGGGGKKAIWNFSKKSSKRKAGSLEGKSDQKKM